MNKKMYITLSVRSIQNSKNLKFHVFRVKHLFCLLLVLRVVQIIIKYLRKKNLLK